MSPQEIGKQYDKIASTWQASMQDSTYGLPLIGRAIRYCEHPKQALDVGCASGGRIINKLLEHSFEVKGIDVSANLLELAKVQHPEVHFELADITSWKSQENYDLIIAWDSIFHLPLEEQEPVLKKLCHYLNPQGVLVYTFGEGYGAIEGICQQERFTYSTLGIEENLKIIQENNCQCRHLELDQYPNNHVSLIVRKNLA